jgi:hypothetical protein
MQEALNHIGTNILHHLATGDIDRALHEYGTLRHIVARERGLMGRRYFPIREDEDFHAYEFILQLHGKEACSPVLMEPTLSRPDLLQQVALAGLTARDWARLPMEATPCR